MYEEEVGKLEHEAKRKRVAEAEQKWLQVGWRRWGFLLLGASLGIDRRS